MKKSRFVSGRGEVVSRGVVNYSVRAPAAQLACIELQHLLKQAEALHISHLMAKISRITEAGTFEGALCARPLFVPF